MKKLICISVLFLSSISFGQASLPELDQADIMSFESDIVSKYGGKYETEVSVVATRNGRVFEKELVSKGSSGQKKMNGSEKKEASINQKFSVKVLQQAAADLLERLGNNSGRMTIQLMFSRRYSLTSDGSDFRDYPIFVSLSDIRRKLRAASRNFPDGAVWNLVSTVDDIEDFEPNKVAVKVRLKLNVLRMNY